MSSRTQSTHSEFGPPLAGGKRRSPGKVRWSRVGLFALLFIGICVSSATITAAALVWYGERQISHADVDTAVPGDIDGDGSVDVPELKELRNVLVVGSDSREGLSAEEREELVTGRFEGTRTDTIMVVQLDPKRHGAAMLSFPRDLLVERCDGTEGRINGAYQIGEDTGLGGPTCVVRTVTELTGIPIHHYIEVDFGGFVEVVDALGGVRLYLDQPIQDPKTRLDLPEGCVELSGAEALSFVRTRQIDNDFGRIARQQRFIREIVDQVTSPRVALNVPKLFNLVEAGAEAVDTDPALSLGVMRRIAFSFRDLRSEQIDARTVPGFTRLISGAAYVVPDEEAAEPLFAAFREGVAAPAELGTEGPAEVKIADVPPVTILNGTTIPGLAASAAEVLRSRGFEVAAVGNAETPTEHTVIEFSGHRREEAQLLAEALDGGRVRRSDEDAEVSVTLGSDVDVEALASEAVEEPPVTTAPSPEPQPTFAGAAPPPGARDC